MQKIEELAEAQARGDKETEMRIRKSVDMTNGSSKAKAARRERDKEKEEKKLETDADGGGGGKGKSKSRGGKERDKGARDKKMADDGDGDVRAAITVQLPEGVVDLETARRKTRLLMQKQDRLLCVGRDAPVVAVHRLRLLLLTSGSIWGVLISRPPTSATLCCAGSRAFTCCGTWRRTWSWSRRW
jgi:hypothetical protein